MECIEDKIEVEFFNIGEDYLVKSTPLRNIADLKEEKKILNELEMCQSIAQIRRVFETEEDLKMVSDFIEGPTLAEVINAGVRFQLLDLKLIAV